MIGTNLLPHTIRPAGSVDQVDEYGNHRRVPGEPGAPVPAFVQPLESSEDLADGQVRQDRARVFVNPGVAVDAWSHVVWEGREYELIGDPQRYDSPDGPHHLVLNVRRTGV